MAASELMDRDEILDTPETRGKVVGRLISEPEKSFENSENKSVNYGTLTPSNKGGAPLKWNDGFIDEVRGAVLAGATTDEKLGSFFGVSGKTIAKWRGKYPEFAAQITIARKATMANVANQMLLSATERKVTEEKVLSSGAIVEYQKIIPGNVRAQENLLRILGDNVFGREDNPWNERAQAKAIESQGEGGAAIDMRWILDSIGEEAEEESPLSHGRFNHEQNEEHI